MTVREELSAIHYNSNCGRGTCTMSRPRGCCCSEDGARVVRSFFSYLCIEEKRRGSAMHRRHSVDGKEVVCLCSWTYIVFLFWTQIIIRVHWFVVRIFLLCKLSAVILVLTLSCLVSPPVHIASWVARSRFSCTNVSCHGILVGHAALFVSLEYVSISAFLRCLHHGRYSCSCAALQRVLCELSAAAFVGQGSTASSDQ